MHQIGERERGPDGGAAGRIVARDRCVECVTGELFSPRPRLGEPPGQGQPGHHGTTVEIGGEGGLARPLLLVGRRQRLQVVVRRPGFAQRLAEGAVRHQRIAVDNPGEGCQAAIATLLRELQRLLHVRQREIGVLKTSQDSRAQVKPAWLLRAAPLLTQQFQRGLKSLRRRPARECPLRTLGGPDQPGDSARVARALEVIRHRVRIRCRGAPRR